MKINSGQAPSTLVPKYIGSDFDQVVTVGKNIEDVKTVAGAADDMAVVIDNLGSVTNVATNLGDVVNVSDNMGYVQDVAAGIAGLPVISYIGEEPPTQPEVGSSWYCTTDGRTYVWYKDVDSYQWVESSPQSAPLDLQDVREALRRSYAEAGYNLVSGSFESGGTLVNANDVLLQERTGKAFSGPAGTVAAGTNPASGGFVDKSGGLLRHELSNVEERLLGVGAKIYRGSNGRYVQNGDVVPAETTHLAVLISGKVEDVALSELGSGVVSLLTETSATIGTTDVTLHQMIAGIAKATDAELAVITPSVGTPWFNTTDNTIHMGDGATQGGIKHLNVSNGSVQIDTVADMLSTTWVKGLPDGTVIRTNTPVVSRWTKSTADPGVGFVKQGVGCFLQLIHEADTTPEAYGAVPDDPNGDYTAEVQAWVDGCVANGFLSINTKKRFTVDSIVINADLDGIRVEYANLYSVENRASSNTSLILVDGESGDIEKFSAGTLILEGRAQWTGNVAADQAANNTSFHNGSGITLLGKPASRLKNVRIEQVYAKQLGNSAVNCASPDVCSVGYINAENIIEHPFGASVTQFGALSTWPGDFKPLYTVERIDCLNSGTIFDFSTVGNAKTDDGGTTRPKGYVGEGFGRNLVQRTKVHGNWDFECGLVDARNDTYDTGKWPAISFASTVYERLRIGKIRGQKVSGGWRFESATVVKQGVSIDEVDLTDCLYAGLRGTDKLTIGSITQNGCGSGISSTFGSLVVNGRWLVKDVDRDYWVNNAPVSWGSVQSDAFIAPSAMDELSVGRFEIDNFGSATNRERYLRFMQPAAGMKVRSKEIYATNPGLNPPDTMFFANGGGVVYDLGVVDEDAQTSVFNLIRLATKGADNYLYLDRLETVSGIQDEFNGTLDRQGYNLWTWLEAGVMRFSTTKPTLKTGGAPI